jgi:hypothetical protein
MSNPYKIRGIPLSSTASDMVHTPSSSNTSLFNSSSGIGIPSGDVKYNGSWFRQTLGETYTQGSTNVFNNGTASYNKYTSNTTISQSQFPENVWGIRVVAIGGGGGGGGGGGSASYTYTGGGGGGGGNGSVLFSPYIPFREEAGSNAISKIKVNIGGKGSGGGTQGRSNGLNGSNGDATTVTLFSNTDSQLLNIKVPGGEGGFGGQVGDNVNAEQNRKRGSGFGGYAGDPAIMTGLLYNTYQDSMELVNCTDQGYGQVLQNTISVNDGFKNIGTASNGSNNNRGTNGNGPTSSINGADGGSRIPAPTNNHPSGGGEGHIRSWTPSGYSTDTYLPSWGVGGKAGAQVSSGIEFGTATEPWAIIPIQSGDYGKGGSGGRGGDHDGNKKSGNNGKNGVVWIFWYYTPPPSLNYTSTPEINYSSDSGYFNNYNMPWFFNNYDALSIQETDLVEQNGQIASRYFKDKYKDGQIIALGYDNSNSKLRVVKYDPDSSDAVNGVIPPYYITSPTNGYFLYIQTAAPDSGTFTFTNADIGDGPELHNFIFPYQSENGYKVTIELVGGGGGGGGGGAGGGTVAGGGGSGGNSGYTYSDNTTMTYINSGARFRMTLGAGGDGGNGAIKSSSTNATDGSDGINSFLSIEWSDSAYQNNTTTYTAVKGEGGKGAGKSVSQIIYSSANTVNNVTIQQIGADSKPQATNGLTNYQGGAGGGGGSNRVSNTGNQAGIHEILWSDTNGQDPPTVSGGSITYQTCPAIIDYTDTSGGGTLPAHGTSTNASNGTEGFGVFITTPPTNLVTNSGYKSNYRLEPTLEGGTGGSGAGPGGNDSGGTGGGGGYNYVTWTNAGTPDQNIIAMGGGGGGGGGGTNGGAGGNGGTLGTLPTQSSPPSGSNKYTNAPAEDGILGSGGGGGQGAGLASWVSDDGAKGGRGGGGYLKITFQKNSS